MLRNPAQERIFDKIELTDAGCWLWLAYCNDDGYGTVSWLGTMIKAHRFSWQSFKGSVPEGFEVCHSCDNPSCVNPEHLFVASHADNIKDSVSKGRHSMQVYGNRSLLPASIAKTRLLSSEQEREMLKLRDVDGISINDLAIRFNLTYTQTNTLLSRVRRGLRYVTAGQL